MYNHIMFIVVTVSAGEIAYGYGPVVDTTQGPVRGFEVKTAHGVVSAFLGIPYAKPPVEELRFEPPVSLPYSEQVYNATVKSRACPQVKMPLGELEIDFGDQDEDCLYLNIWVPLNASGLPVVVYVHGGAFTMGSGNIFMFDGTRLASRIEAIYVTINMRLGPLGFLKMEDMVTPNLGLYDIAHALKWIRKNAKVFGGNPEEISAWGQSAGAIALDLLIKSPLASVHGLMRRVFLQGGSAGTAKTLLASDVENASKKLIYLLGCSFERSWQEENKQQVKNCLKRVPWRQIIEIMSKGNTLDSSALQPSIDGVLIPTDVISSDRIDAGVKDLLVLSDEDEGFVFMTHLFKKLYQTTRLLTVDWLTSLLVMFKFVLQIPYRACYGIIDAYILEHATEGYSVEHNETTLQRTISQIFTDSMFRCPGNFRAMSAAKYGVRVYRGEFHFRPGFSYLPSWAAMSHADEIAYLHGNMADFRPGRTDMPASILEGFTHLSPDDKHFSDEAINVLTDFFHGR